MRGETPITPASPFKFRETALASRVLMFCGSGGVGKTTVAAAVALGLALAGKKVCVMTVDPARRLMDALGLTERGVAPVALDLSPFRERGLLSAEGGSLHALMIHPRETMDELLRKLDPDPALLEKIFANRIYQEASGSLSGSIEYIALGKLYELTEQDYDHIVVDTAPTRYAMDFFEAPENLVNILDARVIRWFLMPLGQLRSSFLGRGLKGIIDRIEHAVGIEIIASIVEFVSLFEHLFEDFRTRVRNMHAILRDPKQTRFFVVGAANATSLLDARDLYNAIRRLQMPMGCVVLNRLHPVFPEQTSQAVTEWAGGLATAGQPGEPEQAQGQELARKLCRSYEQVNQVGQRERRLIAKSLGEHYGQTPSVGIPYLEREVSDLEGLAMIAATLMRE